MGLKQGAIGNTLEENIGNLKGNMLRTKEKLKKPFPSLTPPPKTSLSACFSVPIGCMYFWFPKLLVTIFGVG
jgi:hypothetical protein